MAVYRSAPLQTTSDTALLDLNPLTSLGEQPPCFVGYMSPPGPDGYATIPVLYSLYELAGGTVEYDEQKVDEFTLALMYLVSFEVEKDLGHRAWKGFDWDTLNRLHRKGFIGDPVGKAKSAYVTPEGYKRMEELFHKHFAVNG